MASQRGKTKGIRPYQTCACGETVWFSLSCGPFVSIIDAEDAGKIGHWNWRADVSTYTAYAVRKGPAGDFVQVHRVIMDAPKGIDVDHRNGWGCDNRKDNMRLATVAQNRGNTRRLMARNSSGLRGVSFNKREGKYKATIARVHLGTFGTAIEAALAYDAAAIERWGDFAATNKSMGRLEVLTP